MSILALTSMMVTVGLSGPGTGPYKTSHATFEYDKMDLTNRHIDVCQPLPQTPDQKFPLIAFAHGFEDEAYANYHDIMEEFASWGYVVAAPLACQYGCVDSCKTHLLDPPCYGDYYIQQLQTIDWARSQTQLPINISIGCAVAGHSMGGQATLFSAAYNASTHNIKVVSLLHAYTHLFPPMPSTPFLTFTGTEDHTARPYMAINTFNTNGTSGHRGIINKVGADHHEPSTEYNVKLAAATIAWFKIWLDETPQALGVDFHARIYSNQSNGLCGGYDGKMKECSIVGSGPL